MSDQPTRSTYKYPQPIPMLFTHSRRIHPSIPKTSCFVSFVLFLSTMDFHTLSRKQLQALCKKNKIPANITNVAMADALAALNQVNLSLLYSFLLFFRHWDLAYETSIIATCINFAFRMIKKDRDSCLKLITRIGSLKYVFIIFYLN